MRRPTTETTQASVRTTGKTGGIAATGAWVWLIARVVYVPLYAFGVPYVRSLVWLVAAGGLVLVIAALFV